MHHVLALDSFAAFTYGRKSDRLLVVSLLLLVRDALEEVVRLVACFLDRIGDAVLLRDDRVLVLFLRLGEVYRLSF